MITPLVFLILIGIIVVTIALWYVHKHSHSDDYKDTRDSDSKKLLIHP